MRVTWGNTAVTCVQHLSHPHTAPETQMQTQACAGGGGGGGNGLVGGGHGGGRGGGDGGGAGGREGALLPKHRAAVLWRTVTAELATHRNSHETTIGKFSRSRTHIITRVYM